MNMSIKYYVLGGPRYKPPRISRGSPRLHFILMCMFMQLLVCSPRLHFILMCMLNCLCNCLYVVAEIKFNSIHHQFEVFALICGKGIPVFYCMCNFIMWVTPVLWLQGLVLFVMWFACRQTYPLSER